MTNVVWNKKSALGCIALALSLGGTSLAHAGEWKAAPITLAEDERIIVDQLVILVDVTGSIGFLSVFKYQKALVTAFAGMMPDGTYEAGIDSFAGVSSCEWLTQPLAPYNRAETVRSATNIEPLGHTTPLARAIHAQKAEFEGKQGRGALLVFSDGEVANAQDVLEACRDLQTAHGGNLCIFTVQAGSSKRGKIVLQDMANVNGCGKYFDGASLRSVSAMNAMVREIFVGPRIVQARFVRDMEPIALSVETILLDNDSFTVPSYYDGMLDEASSTFRQYPKLTIRLEGHTDANASNHYNQGLSECCVDAVRAALVRRGINDSHIRSSVYGEERPTVSNNSHENLNLNRRVDLPVVGSSGMIGN